MTIVYNYKNGIKNIAKKNLDFLNIFFKTRTKNYFLIYFCADLQCLC